MFALSVVATILLAIAASEVRIPFEIEKARRGIIVEVRVEGRPARFLVDTGASRTVVDNDLLGIPRADLLAPRVRTAEPGLANRAGLIVTVASLSLGKALELKDQEVWVLDMDPLSQTYGLGVQGLIGVDVLREFDEVAFDFRARTMVLRR